MYERLLAILSTFFSSAYHVLMNLSIGMSICGVIYTALFNTTMLGQPVLAWTAATITLLILHVLILLILDPQS